MAKDANEILKSGGNVEVAKELKKIFSDTTEKFEQIDKETARIKAEFDAQKQAEAEKARRADLLQKIFFLPFTDHDNADRLNAMFGNVIRYEKINGLWGIFDDGVWLFNSKKDSAIYPFTRELVNFVSDNRPKQTYTQNADGSITSDPTKPAVSLEAVKAGENLLRSLKKAKTQRAAIDLLKGIDSILITPADLDKHPMLLNVKNGVINLEDGKLYPAAPELLLTKQANVIFNPAARAPAFEKFIQQILPDNETRAAVLRFLGYCLTGNVNEEKAMFVWGKGGNGKGTLFQTFLKLLGTYGTAFNIEALLKQKTPKDGEAATPEFAKLENTRIAVAEEIPKGREFKVDRFKLVTGRDPIPVRPLYQAARSIDNPTCKMIFSGNDLPQAESAGDEGYNRRLLVVKFTQQFTGDSADLNLKDKLQVPAELSGIFNILLAECLTWQKPKAQGGGLIQSEAMQAEKQSYLADNDWLADFIDEECELGEGFTVPRKTLLKCLRHKYPRAALLSDRQLTEMLQNVKGVGYQRGNGKNATRGAYVFTGIRFIEENSLFEENDGVPNSAF